MKAPAKDRCHWRLAGLVALAGHAGVAVLVLVSTRPVDPPEPEPVVLVELPPPSVTVPVAANVQAAPRQPAAAQAMPAPHPPIETPPAAAPIPHNPVTLPPPAPVARVSDAAVPAAAASSATNAPSLVEPPTTARAGASVTPGTDPRTQRQEADYFALVSTHLNRRKVYPAEARRARQQGVVTVRFTVDRQGRVSDISIRRSSGHDVLDSATLDLVQRVAPLPPMPPSMTRDRVTLTLPIEYSLRIN